MLTKNQGKTLKLVSIFGLTSLSTFALSFYSMKKFNIYKWDFAFIFKRKLFS